MLAITLVAFAASPAFVDHYTSVKWYVLEAAAAAWLLAARLAGGGRGLPSFVRRTWIGWVALLGWIVASSLRHGLAWAAAPLVARASFAAIVLASCWCFGGAGLRVGTLRAAVAVAATVVTAIGLAQFAGARGLPGLGAGDGLSATFGNVNMAAQFLGLALVVILSVPSPTASRASLTGLLAACIVAYVVVAGARSVALSLVAALAVLALARRLPARRLAGTMAVAAALVLALVLLSPAARRPIDPGAQASKAASARWRLAVWSDTLGLVRDHPLGVGAGNFEHAFIPYALAGRSRPGESLVFRSPHNDYLRLVAEEGVPAAILLAALLVLLWRALRRSEACPLRSEAGALLASCAAFLAVEAFVQFPFEMAFPALLAAVLLGLALAMVDAPGERMRPVDRRAASISGAGTVVVVVFAVAMMAGALRVATAEVLFVTRPDEPLAQERACALDPRRVDACTRAAWLRSRSGDHAVARQLLDGVLRHSPHYFPAIKLMAEDRLAAGERQAGCDSARAYDTLFGGTSSLRELLARECRTPPSADGR